MKLSIQLLVAVFLTLNCIATTTNQQAKQLLSKQNEKGFIENQGQWHSDVLYLARMNGLDAWITKKGVNYTFYKLEEVSTADNEKQILPHDKFDHKDYSIIGHRVLVNLQNNNLNPTSEGKQKQEGYYNYLIGNNRSKHASSVSLYNEVVVKNVYQGIDMRYYFDKGSLRYDYVVQPGADPSQIEFKLQGHYKTYLQKNNLIFTTRFGEVLITELKTFQHTDRKEISSLFVRTNNDNWSITVGNYDRSQPLIIDPLIYSTFIGGSGNDFGIDIAIDSNRNAYITGYTYSTDYDTTTGVFQTTSGVDYDVFVTKLNPTGAALIYSTYIGGNGADEGTSIAIDGSGNTYITGRTISTNYPVTIGAFQTTLTMATTNTPSRDVFVTKLNANGNNLIYSTYIGGNSHDMATSIAIDTSGNAYVTGEAYSNNFPVTTGAFQTIKAGSSDNFVTKLNTSGTSLVYSTFVGGSKYDISYSIALDNNENVYITGYTYSTNYPVTSGSYQTFFGGGVDVFVTKLNTSGTALIYSTYIGGGNNNIARDIAIDGSGNAYVSGETINPYPVTAGAYQTTYRGGGDVFVTKLNPTGTTLVYSTFIGGSNLDQVHSIVVDNIGNAYITGQTQSTDYPVTAGAYQTNHGGGFNAVFVTKLNAIGSNLTYSTYIGGINSDIGYGITIDGSNNAYVTGVGLATYPTTFGAYQTTHGGGGDVFVTKLCMEVSGSVTLTSSPGSNNQTVCINSPINNITYTTTGGATGATFSGLPTGTTGSWANNTIIISGTPSVSGTFNYTITLTSNCSTITDTGIIIVYPNATSTDLKTSCDSFTWINGITYTTSTNTPKDTLVAANGCDSIVTLNLTISNSATSTDLQTACDSFTWINGMTYTVSTNTPKDTFVTVNGCDSIVTLNLTINTFASGTDIITSCTPITWIDGNTYSATTNTPTFTIVGGATNGCDSIVTLNFTITPPTSTTQTFNECEGFSVTVGANTYSTTGTFIDVLNGCDTVTTNLTIYPAPQLTLIKTDDNCDEQTGSVTAIASSNNPPIIYNWNIGSTDSIINNLPAGLYSIIVADNNNCMNTDSILVMNITTDCEPTIFIPNVFSPNGDNHNDLFMVQLVGLEFENLQIYNRWGVLLFETKSSNEGWDGRTTAGEIAADGTYFYILNYKDKDEKQIKKGTLTLLR